MSDKKFRIILLKKFSELQEHTEYMELETHQKKSQNYKI